MNELLAFGRLMPKVVVRQCDFADLVEDAVKGDFIYLNPPYAGRDVRNRSEYGIGAFKMTDTQRSSLSPVQLRHGSRRPALAGCVETKWFYAVTSRFPA